MGAEMNIRIIPFERLIEQDKNPRGVFAKKWEVCVECNSLEEVEKLKEALAQPEQEPVAWRTFDGEGNYDFLEYEANESYRDEYIKCNGTKYASWVDPLYTTPPQRKPLTDEEIAKAWAQSKGDILMRLKPFARAIEAAHGIKE